MNLAEVFMLQNWDKANMNTNDLSVALTVTKKCSVFPPTILPLADKLRKSRNKIAHTTSLDEHDNQTVFYNIKQVIQHADVVNYLQNPHEIQNIINDLENGDLFKFENELKEIVKNTNEVKKRLITLDTKLNMVHEDQSNTFRTIQRSVIATCMVALAAVLVSVKPDLQRTFKILHFKPPMEKTEEELKKTKKNGILLEADMGYGKSAVAAHIICAKEGDTEFNETVNE
ncbi:hypothetical protein MAR_026027 [Mya arenaria]|uniref:Uncharacterized protein n=1 Tax=Mya arenaria TaxID=6604 RepID=A0ABY7ESD2_MYAAR|nr:hypothetical protein MAR_026027 [Mya arenaria]